MQFRLLGPLEVIDGDEPIVIAAPKQRALLAMLVLHHGDPDPAPVSVFRLERPGGSDAISSEDGARLLAPIAPPRRLWATRG